MTRQAAPRIGTRRLVLNPVTADILQNILIGDLSELNPGVGWPHADTMDAMTMATAADAGPGWLIAVDGRTIGDCGAYAWPNESGVVEVGYGLAAPSRRHGYATEAVRAVCGWLFTDANALLITATDVLADNVASRRLLQRLGFVLTKEDAGSVSYALTREGFHPEP